MTRLTAVAIVAFVALVVGPKAAPPADVRSFLAAAFSLSPADQRRIDAGQVFARTLDVDNRREVATLGIVRIGTTPEVYVERLQDIVVFKRFDDVLQIGRFSDSPQLADVASLTLEEPDVREMRQCRVGDCGVRLGVEAIERLRQGVDWRSTDAAGKAVELFRQLLVDHVGRYRELGSPALMEYADTPSRLNGAREFASLVHAETGVWQHVPGMRGHLLDFPATDTSRSSDFVYWSKERVHRKLVISATHVAIVHGAEASPVQYAVASKQIYAMHYFDASLGLTLLVRDAAARTPSTFVVYLNRSRIDLFDAPFGGIARKIVAGRARSLVGDLLGRLQKTLSSNAG